MPNTNFLFHFLKYVNPTWYFNLQTPSHIPYWIDYRKAGTTFDGMDSVNFDEAYESNEAQARDVAYQLLIKGVISETESLALELGSYTVTVADEYRFIKRFFNPLWSFYVLILRILCFHNPVKEINGFFSAMSIQRVDLFKKVNKHFPSRTSYNANELVSVILPTLNRYTYLSDILSDLEQQTYKNFEVIIIDQSSPFHKAFYTEFKLKLKVIHQPNPGLWQARNSGVRVSNGHYIAFTEDDVRVAPDWLEQHLNCIHLFKVDISAGIFYAKGSQVPIDKVFFRWAEQFASGNALVRKTVFNKVGLFDLQFERMRMGDGEFGLRCHVNGIKSISNPLAYCLDVKAPVGGLRQMGSWDGWRPNKIFAPRPVPSVLYLYRKYFGNRAALSSMIVMLFPSIIPYRWKGRNEILLFLVLFLPILFPFVLIQGYLSWRLANKKLKEGARIEVL